MKLVMMFAKGILDAELEDWNKVMAINSTGVWLGMKAVIPHMQKMVVVQL